MANSYARLAALEDEEEKPKSSYARLASLADDDDGSAPAETPDDGLPADFPRHEEGDSTGDWWKKEISALTRPQTWKRQAKLGARAIYEGVAGLPIMAADAGVGARNLITGSNYQLPSEMQRESLNEFLPEAQTAQEKVASFTGSVLAGAKLPAPQIAKPAPKGFVAPSANPLAPIAQEAQAAGYVVPPATLSGSKLAKLTESVAGKTAVAQGASIKNQQVTNDLVRKALGIAEGEQITPGKLAGIREAAGKVYAQIGDAGEIVPDQAYLDDLAQLGRGADEIAKSFPGANVGATKQIDELVTSLLQNKFDSKAALQYLRELRKMAGANTSGMNAADPAKQALGMAQREAAGTLEDLIGRHLERVGKKDVADSFAGARKMIAMTHSVENALNETTGNVVAGKLGQQMAKGKPLSGELELAAKFSRAFPKASKEVTESMPGVSPLDWMASGGIGAITGSPWAALLPSARIATREAALSPALQRLLSPAGKPYQGGPVDMGLAPSAAIQLLSGE